MADVLGFEKFAFQGGDWGAYIGSIIGYRHPERLIGLHLNLLAVRRDPSLLTNPTPEEKQFLGELNEFLKEETGYQWIQGTRPQTLAFGLTDSPSALAAWVAEKFHRWTDNNGTPEDAVSRDASEASKPSGVLSERELDVLRLLRSDLSGPDIANELVVSLNTLRTHTKSIYAKLGVSSRRAAVRRAAELGLLP